MSAASIFRHMRAPARPADNAASGPTAIHPRKDDKMKRHSALAALALLSLHLPAARAADSFGYGKIGTGVELGVGYALNDALDLRVGIADTFRYRQDKSLDGSPYQLKSQANPGLAASLDWRPARGSGFRLTGGLLLSGKPRDDLAFSADGAGNYTLNGNAYAASAAGPLNGKVEYRQLGAYLGAGWDFTLPEASRWRVTADLGAQLRFGGKATLNPAGGIAAADLAAARQKLDHDLGGTQFRLSAGVGLSYAF
ncbi:hypothetical protein DK843_20665 [Chromobacterium phragmitis]|uniref:Outer membrane protein beta-barrel domain-containing protein n=3 Tax=Chromobacterium phragmitis TaxID=2202141 RepID=A0A344UMJ8_9NEIS|nr:hypothetical protein DK843_20665 [Chromobacterium phragmitis]